MSPREELGVIYLESVKEMRMWR